MSDAETVLRNLLDACDRGRPLSDIADRLRVEVGRLDRATAAPTRPTREQVRKAIAEAHGPAGDIANLLGESGVDWATDAVMALLAGEDHTVTCSDCHTTRTDRGPERYPCPACGSDTPPPAGEGVVSDATPVPVPDEWAADLDATPSRDAATFDPGPWGPTGHALARAASGEGTAPQPAMAEDSGPRGACQLRGMAFGAPSGFRCLHPATVWVERRRKEPNDPHRDEVVAICEHHVGTAHAYGWKRRGTAPQVPAVRVVAADGAPQEGEERG